MRPQDIGYMRQLMHITSEQDLQRQLALTKNQLRDLRISNESNQAKLLDHTQRQGMCTLVVVY